MNVSEWTVAFKLWWSFAWRLVLLVLGVTIVLALAGAAWGAAGLSLGAWDRISLVLSTAAALLAQVEAFRRVIRAWRLEPRG